MAYVDEEIWIKYEFSLIFLVSNSDINFLKTYKQLLMSDYTFSAMCYLISFVMVAENFSCANQTSFKTYTVGHFNERFRKDNIDFDSQLWTLTSSELNSAELH